MRPDPTRQSELSVQRTDAGPLNADWVWQPDGWIRGAVGAGDLIAPGIRLFHDDPTAAITALASPGGVTLEIPGFQGDFISLAVDLPTEAVTKLTTGHVISADIGIARPNHSAAFLRLNLRLGPDTVSRIAGLGDAAEWRGIDLLGAFDDARSVDHAWLDLIVERPTTGPLTFTLREVRRHFRPAM